MSWFDAFVLGVVQGLTEFLPVSSSGHLVIGQTLLDIPLPGVFVEVALHVATLLSVVIVYRGRLAQLAVGALRQERDALVYIGLLALGTVPAAVVGLLFEDVIEGLFDTPAVTGFMLLVTGLLLWSTRYVTDRRLISRPGWGLALVIGVAQACAIVPGISRSGATITAALWGRVAGERAAEFSFLLSLPAIAGAAVLQVRGLGDSVQAVGSGAIALGFVAALVAGVAAIRWLVWLVERHEFDRFAYYVWSVGALFLALLAFGG